MGCTASHVGVDGAAAPVWKRGTTTTVVLDVAGGDAHAVDLCAAASFRDLRSRCIGAFREFANVSLFVERASIYVETADGRRADILSFASAAAAVAAAQDRKSVV